MFVIQNTTCLLIQSAVINSSTSLYNYDDDCDLRAALRLATGNVWSCRKRYMITTLNFWHYTTCTCFDKNASYYIKFDSPQA